MTAFDWTSRWSMRSIVMLFFFNDTATTEIYTLSLHDALPISHRRVSHGLARRLQRRVAGDGARRFQALRLASRDRKSTRLNSSHSQISYAVFCLKKKNDYSRGGARSSPSYSLHQPSTLSLPTV